MLTDARDCRGAYPQKSAGSTGADPSVKGKTARAGEGQPGAKKSCADKEDRWRRFCSSQEMPGCSDLHQDMIYLSEPASGQNDRRKSKLCSATKRSCTHGSDVGEKRTFADAGGPAQKQAGSLFRRGAPCYCRTPHVSTGTQDTALRERGGRQEYAMSKILPEAGSSKVLRKVGRTFCNNLRQFLHNDDFCAPISAGRMHQEPYKCGR